MRPLSVIDCPPSQRLQISVTPWHSLGAGDADALCKQAETAELLGFHGFFLPENHFTGDGAIPEPLMLLAAVAARTRKIRLGTTSFLLPVRHPLQAAEQVAVLDRLCGGRLTLGLGRGFQQALFDAFAVDTQDKRKLFDVALTRMRQAWAGEPVVGDAVLAPLPVQKPHPPLWVAAFGPLALQQAGRLGLPYLASPVEPFNLVRENLQRWEAALAEFNQPRPVDMPIMRTVFVSADRQRLAEVRDRLASQARVQASTTRLRGAAAADAAQVDEWAIVGTPDEVQDGIARYQDIGMNALVATRLRLIDLPRDWLEESIGLLADLQPALA